MLLFICLCVVDFSSLLGDKKIASVDYVDNGYRKKDDLDFEEDRIALEGKVVDIVRSSNSFLLAKDFDDKVEDKIAISLSGNEETIRIVNEIIEKHADTLGFVTSGNLQEAREGLVGYVDSNIASNRTALEGKIDDMRKEVIGDYAPLPVGNPEDIYRPGVFVNGTATIGGNDVDFSLANNNTFTHNGADYFIKVDNGEIVVCPVAGGQCISTKEVAIYASDGKYASKDYVDSSLAGYRLFKDLQYNDDKIALASYVDNAIQKNMSSLEGKVVDIVQNNGSFVLADDFDNKVSTAVGKALDENGGLKDTLESAIKDKVDSMDNLATKADIYNKDEYDKYTVAKYVLLADYNNEKGNYYSKAEYAFIDNNDAPPAGSMSFYSGKAIKDIFEELVENIV